MSFRDLLADTFHTLAAHKRRTALTMFGITWGIVSITLMVAAGEGLRVGLRAEEGRVRPGLHRLLGRAHQPAGRRHAGREADPVDGHRPRPGAAGLPFVPPRDAGARPGRRPRPKLVQRREPARDRLAAAVRRDPQHLRRRGTLPELGGRGAGPAGRSPRLRGQEAALRGPSRARGDDPGRRTSRTPWSGWRGRRRRTATTTGPTRARSSCPSGPSCATCPRGRPSGPTRWTGCS